MHLHGRDLGCCGEVAAYPQRVTPWSGVEGVGVTLQAAAPSDGLVFPVHRFDLGFSRLGQFTAARATSSVAFVIHGRNGKTAVVMAP